MQFAHEAEEYAKNLKKYGDMDEVMFSPSQSLEEVIGKLKEIPSKRKRLPISKTGSLASDCFCYASGKCRKE